jgi:hypothetical protein
MRKVSAIFSCALTVSTFFGTAYAEDSARLLKAPEPREQLDGKRMELLFVLATDAMFIRHFASDRAKKLKEMEINASLQPGNVKLKAAHDVRKQEMEECLKEAQTIQQNFLVAYAQLDEAKYDVTRFKSLSDYVRKNTVVFKKNDVLSQEEMDGYMQMRPGMKFRSACIDNGSAPKIKDESGFVSPTHEKK